jgi:hypothetical protein
MLYLCLSPMSWRRHPLIKHHDMKVHEWVELYLHAFSTSALNRDEWSASRLSRFISGEGTPSFHWISDWIGTRVGEEMVAKNSLHCSCWELNPSRSACSLATILTEEINFYLTVIETQPCYMIACHHGTSSPWVADRGDCLQVLKIATNLLTADNGWPFSLETSFLRSV